MSTVPQAGGSKAASSKVVAIINGNSGLLSVVEKRIAAGHYDVVMVETIGTAFSHIRQTKPDLVILGLDINNWNGFHVLTMLKLDEETKYIPIITYTLCAENDTEYEEEEFAIDVSNPTLQLRMN